MTDRALPASMHRRLQGPPPVVGRPRKEVHMPEGKALRLIFASSAIIAALVVAASLLGLFAPATYRYETNNWRMQAWGQDVGNVLAAGVLLGSIHRVTKRSFTGFLVWVGTLFYLLYAYVVYSVAVHFNFLFLVYTTILGLVLYTLIYALAVSNLPDAAAYPRGRPRTLAGYVLVLTGALFAALWLSEVVPAIVTGTEPKSLTEAVLVVNPIHAVDLSAVLPAFILTGVLALKDRRVGLFFLAPWLTFSVLMGTSIVCAMAIIIARGDETAVPPLIMVTLIVGASLAALWAYLAGLSGSWVPADARGDGVSADGG